MISTIIEESLTVRPYEQIIFTGKPIIVVDISDADPESMIAALYEAQTIIAQLPLKSGLILVDASETTFTRVSQEALREFAIQNTPFVRASAVVVSEGMRTSWIQTISRVVGREIKTFKDRQEAMDWLVSRA